MTIYFWIYENQIAGDSDNLIPEEERPDGWELIEAPQGATLINSYWDGNQIQLKPPQPSDNHFWDPELNEWATAPEPPPLPQWDSLVADFQTPGNPLYLSIASKVAQSGFLVQDHFQNFKALIMTPNLRSVEILALSTLHLHEMLIEANHPMSSTDITGWNDLMDTYNFPDSCKINAD